jgi:sodium-dependent dicarboxylate transporter 2/3/5
MLPATIGASASFMLPAGCASNAIAYGTGLVPSRVMIREGIVLDVLGAVVAAGVCALLL